ncbi:hypothetical protein NECAME_09295 [Necator americanus]|uniref:Uncharacterized protein n=1 Tax=Necator americanus TaxID=51031 RepID=W2TGT1_NECAM|nr:hypothetical protein NECAME_09295 [Necator americanus]ETN80242.1 hypothetical protein NECAME_09295 [Necator americanus]
MVDRHRILQSVLIILHNGNCLYNYLAATFGGGFAVHGGGFGGAGPVLFGGGFDGGPGAAFVPERVKTSIVIGEGSKKLHMSVLHDRCRRKGKKRWGCPSFGFFLHTFGDNFTTNETIIRGSD